MPRPVLDRLPATGQVLVPGAVPPELVRHIPSSSQSPPSSVNVSYRVSPSGRNATRVPVTGSPPPPHNEEATSTESCRDTATSPAGNSINDNESYPPQGEQRSLTSRPPLHPLRVVHPIVRPNPYSPANSPAVITHPASPVISPSPGNPAPSRYPAPDQSGSPGNAPRHRPPINNSPAELHHAAPPAAKTPPTTTTPPSQIRLTPMCPLLHLEFHSPPRRWPPHHPIGSAPVAPPTIDKRSSRETTDETAGSTARAQARKAPQNGPAVARVPEQGQTTEPTSPRWVSTKRTVGGLGGSAPQDDGETPKVSALREQKTPRRGG